MFGSRDDYENGPWNIGKRYAEADKTGLPELFIGCGEHDIAVHHQVNTFCRMLRQHGIPFSWWSNDGNHDIDTWEQMLDPAFSFLSGIPEGTRNSLAIPKSIHVREAIVK